MAGDGVIFLLGAEVGGEQVAGCVGAGVLGEVDEIDGRAALFVEFGDFVLELGGGVIEFERDWALVGLDEGGGRGEVLVFGIQFSEKRKKCRGWRISGGSRRTATLVAGFARRRRASDRSSSETRP